MGVFFRSGAGGINERSLAALHPITAQVSIRLEVRLIYEPVLGGCGEQIHILLHEYRAFRSQGFEQAFLRALSWRAVAVSCFLLRATRNVHINASRHLCYLRYHLSWLAGGALPALRCYR